MKLRKLTAGLLAVAIACSGVVIMPEKAEASVPTSVYWVDTEELDAETVMSDGVPTCDKPGYVFAGWYDYDGTSDDPIALTSTDDVVENSIYVKWIPASWLTVKTQNKANTSESTESTDMRFVFAVDSLDYKEVGFTIQLNNDPNNEQEETNTKKVYTGMEAGSKTYKPSELFGDGVEYLAVWRLRNVNQQNFGKIIYVRPYIKTADGTKVEGVPKYVHVEDGYKKLINVPVSIKSAVGIAAGVASISFDDSKLTYEGFEAGRIFDSEMDAAVSGSKVKFVGNVSNISNNVDNADDIFVNLKFSVNEGVTMSDLYSTLEFNVSDSDFCDKDEQSQTVTFTDVRY